jgi:hypothetical protein
MCQSLTHSKRTDYNINSYNVSGVNTMQKCKFCQKPTRNNYCNEQCKIDYHNTRRKFYRKIETMKRLILEAQEIGQILPPEEFYAAAQEVINVGAPGNPHTPTKHIIYECYWCRRTTASKRPSLSRLRQPALLADNYPRRLTAIRPGDSRNTHPSN